MITPATAFRRVGDLDVLSWPALGIDAGVTARAGGVSSGAYSSLNMSLTVGDDPECVLENRRRVAAAFGAALDDFVYARQVHGSGVHVVGEQDRGRGAFGVDDPIPDTDALVTATPGVVLAILTADCVPIVLHDPVAGVLACVHSGWRGTAARIAAAAVAAMEKLGSRPADIIAGIGPAIDPARYQVGPDVHAAFSGPAFGAAAPFIRPDPAASADDPRWLLDLWTANRLVLTEAGLSEENVHVTDIPTGARPAGAPAFFSDRAERPCGRLALVARLPEGGR
jgi:purine-nucleoside/S-methyl-5'-thioadenosine phosphorylase / adenosine deaminase